MLIFTLERDNMKTFFIVERGTNNVASQYDATAPIAFGGPLGDSSVYETVELPEGKDKRVVQVARVDDAIVFNDSAEKMRQINTVELAQYRVARDAQAEVAMMALLKTITGEDMDYTTHLAVSQQMTDIFRYPDDYTPEQVAEAQVVVPAYKQAWVDIRAIRVQRDADIANFVPTFATITPLYNEV